MTLTAPILEEPIGRINETRVTGDLHGRATQLVNLPKEFNNPDNILIILGDAGFNYYLDNRDYRFKKYITDTYKFKIYCVRGNHEARPQSIDPIKRVYDLTVEGYVYYDPRFPTIRYFEDFGIYNIQGYRTLVIGGAYSVDKEYRILRGWQWFEDEMLSEDEQKKALDLARNQYFDFVLTHTCPLSWEPTDLFLALIDQSKVDQTMEIFLETIKDNIIYNHWLFGHFHDDRVVRENVEIYYYYNDTLKNIQARWGKYQCGDITSLDGMKLDPKFEVIKRWLD